MNAWSSHRKFLIFCLGFLALVVLIGLPIYLATHRPSSCFDSKLNGDETGVDCGGSCQLMCTSDSLPIIMKGDPRVLKVASTTYDIVVYAQNPNLLGKVDKAGYTIKIYDTASSTPLKVLTGVTSVPKNTSFAVFNGPFNFGNQVPVRATFVWSEPLKWQKDTSAAPTLEVRDPLLSETTTKPHVTATLNNVGLGDISNIELVALVEDNTGNIIGASKTLVDSLASGASTQLIFTWPTPFQGTSTSVLIIPHVYSDSSLIY